VSPRVRLPGQKFDDVPRGHSLAIWERNVFISTIAISAWLVTIAFYMRSTFSRSCYQSAAGILITRDVALVGVVQVRYSQQPEPRPLLTSIA
jgi:hypothetical protein